MHIKVTRPALPPLWCSLGISYCTRESSLGTEKNPPCHVSCRFNIPKAERQGERGASYNTPFALLFWELPIYPSRLRLSPWPLCQVSPVPLPWLCSQPVQHTFCVSLAMLYILGLVTCLFCETTRFLRKGGCCHHLFRRIAQDPDHSKPSVQMRCD